MIAAKCMVSLMTERNIETISGCYKTMAKYWLTCVVNCMCIDKIHLRKCDLLRDIYSLQLHTPY